MIYAGGFEWMSRHKDLHCIPCVCGAASLLDRTSWSHTFFLTHFGHSHPEHAFSLTDTDSEQRRHTGPTQATFIPSSCLSRSGSDPTLGFHSDWSLLYCSVILLLLLLLWVIHTWLDDALIWVNFSLAVKDLSFRTFFQMHKSPSLCFKTCCHHGVTAGMLFQHTEQEWITRTTIWWISVNICREINDPPNVCLMFYCKVSQHLITGSAQIFQFEPK